MPKQLYLPFGMYNFADPFTTLPVMTSRYDKASIERLRMANVLELLVLSL